MNYVGDHLSFSPPQRRAMILLLTLLIAYGLYRYATNPIYIDAPQPPAGDLAGDLADKLDPNTADAADLAALPGLGDKRAAAIVARRQRVIERDHVDVAFRSIDDLLIVPGFGRATAEQLRPFLAFPTTRPATTQSAADKSRTAR